jgi:hypothetical protein
MDPKQVLAELQNILEEYVAAYRQPRFEQTRVRLLARLNDGARELDECAFRSHASDSIGHDVVGDDPR